MNLKEVNNNPYLLEFIKQAENKLAALQYTSHGLDHCNLVADRARTVAKEINLREREQEIAAIAGFCHDFANFLSRTYHNYLGAVIFQQLFKDDFPPSEMASLMQAIANHDKDEMEFTDPVSAVLVLADKSDVRRSRVTIKEKKLIGSDIHNRVNYATKASKLGIDKTDKIITLSLEIDTNFVPIIEYFEIFTDRMVYCRKAAQYLGYQFSLVINDFKLL